MSTCSRCGSAECRWYDYQQQDECERSASVAAICALDCRYRELANLRSLLRSVTGRLECALEHLSDAESSVSVAKAEMCITSILEALL